MPANIAIVVPVLDDSQALTALLSRIATWREQPAEVVIAAAKHDAALNELVAVHNCLLVEAPANRGAQMDIGARAAKATILWFLHADAQPPVEALASITAAVAAGAVGGCLQFEFQGARTWYKRLLAALVSLRLRLGGIPYGDQGLFARKQAYFAAGGFPHQPLFEEVRLVRGMRKLGRFIVLPLALPVSTRRWDRDGWWTRTFHNRWLACCYAFGMSAERLSANYHGRSGPLETH